MYPVFLDPLIAQLLEIFSNPQSRLFWLYWLSGGIVAGIWLMLGWSGRKGIALRFVTKSYWLGQSSRQDMALILLNQTLFLLLGISWSLWVLGISVSVFEGMAWVASPDFLENGKRELTVAFIAVYSTLLFLLDDFSRYGLHRLMHRVPFLWRIHRLHHSANYLTPLTFLRVHPLEKLLYQFRSVLVHGVMIGVGFYWLGSKPESFLLFGVSAAVILFNTFGAILRHSEFAISFGFFEKFFISPFQHQIHHSVVGQRTNYGSVLSVWDRIFNSVLFSTGKVPNAFPLPKTDNESLTRQLLVRTPLALK